MNNLDRILDTLCDQGDGAVAVPLRHKRGAMICAALSDCYIIGTPLFVHGDAVRRATIQELKDAQLDRPIDRWAGC